MHILIHDYAGHPFQAELSRHLAARGHRVNHAYFAADTGPKGRMSVQPRDSKQLEFIPVGQDISYSKTSFIKRRQGDVAYGRRLGQLVEQVRPDLVISGNTPTEAQRDLVRICGQKQVPFVYWCQDFYSIAASRLLARKMPGLGHLIGAWYRFLERRQMQQAAHVVLITDAFKAQTRAWGITSDKVTTIPNWGALNEIDPLPRNTAWATDTGLSDGKRFLYSGTLALKHNPAHLESLARQLAAPDELVLVSAGVGADRLRAQADDLPRMRPLPLQPFDQFAEVLGAADVLLALIEREAGQFSVPSKILSYLCAGRPIVLAAPKDNLAAQILQDTGAGVVVAPEDTEGFCAAALHFAQDPVAAERAGAAGRAYAEANFDLDRVADRFEALFDVVVTGQARLASAKRADTLADAADLSRAS